jgi:hypothetical protein
MTTPSWFSRIPTVAQQRCDLADIPERVLDKA